MNLIYSSIILVTAILTASADYFIKIASTKNSFLNIWFILGSFFYLLTAFSWYYAVKNNYLFSTGILYDMTVIILLVLIGFFVLNEKINLYSSLGILFAILSIILISKS